MSILQKVKSFLKNPGQKGVNPFLILPYKPEEPTLLTADQKRAWVNNLRTGRYAQGTGKLRDVYERYCVLGVLCDTIDPNAWTPHRNVDGQKIMYLWNGSPVMLSNKILDSETQGHLWLLNDVRTRFSVLADWIEENVPVKEES